MCRKFIPDELNTMDHESKNDVIYQMQDHLDQLKHDYENLMEQVRLANQCDETPVEVIHGGRPAGSKSYMWIHLTGELSPVLKIIL